LDPLGRDCRDLDTCPTKNDPQTGGGGSKGSGGVKIIPRIDEIPLAGDGLRITNIDDGLGGILDDTGDQVTEFERLRTCPEDSFRCCYDSQADLSSASGPICDPDSPQGQNEDWSLSNCEERMVPNGGRVGIIPRRGDRSITCGQRGTSITSMKDTAYRSSQAFRSFPEALPSRAAPLEFPWFCVVVDESGKKIAGCAVIPEAFDNDINDGTSSVVTVAHRVDKYK